jgi:drug/metabolite transporter (DMT)-like permease
VILGVFFLVFRGAECLTMYYSHKADINVGIVATLWLSSPIFTAILDYLLNSTKISNYHISGMVLMIACGALISLSKTNEDHNS